MRRNIWVSALFLPFLLLNGCSEGEPDTYEISGTVVDSDGSGLQGVIIEFGAGISSGLTGANGSWSKAGLEGSVTVTPRREGWTFQPPSITVNGARDDVDFVGTAEQVQTEHTVTVMADPAAGGTVDGGGTFDTGTEITVTATANEGFMFLEWTENANRVSLDAAYTFIVDADRSLTARFGEPSFETAVTLTGGASSSDRFSGSQTAGNLIADAMLDATEASIALFPSVNMQHGVAIEPGSFTAEDLLSIYAGHIAENSVVVADILVSDLQAVMLARSQAYDNVNDQISGFEYTIYTNENGEVRSLTIHDADGSMLLPGDLIRVAFCSHTFENHYEVEGRVQNEQLIPTPQTEILLRYAASFTTPIPASLADDRIFIEVDTEPGPAFAETEVTLTAGENSSDRFTGSNTAANLITDAIRDQTGADFATINSTAMSAGSAIEPGSFSQDELLALYSQHIANNHAVVGEISGSELKALLLRQSQRHDNVDIQVSGFSYDIHLDANDEAVSVTVRDGAGNPLSDSTMYTVTFNSHNFQFYDLDGIISNRQDTVESEQEMLLQYVGALPGPIPTSLANERVTIVPGG